MHVQHRYANRHNRIAGWSIDIVRRLSLRRIDRVLLPHGCSDGRRSRADNLVAADVLAICDAPDLRHLSATH